MVDNAQLSKILKDAMKGGKYAVGAKESIAAMKGSKAVLCTRSIPPGSGAKLREEAKKHGVPVVELRHVLRRAREDDRKALQGLGPGAAFRRARRT